MENLKELEERSKKIFNNLGLKDLDIKIWENINGKTNEKHVHVDKDGIKSDSKSGTQAQEQEKIEDKKEKSSSNSETSRASGLIGKIANDFKRKTDTLNNVSKWLSGDITTDKLLENCKKMFEERVRDEFGDNISPEKFAEEIEKTAQNLINSPTVAGAFKHLNELGIKMNIDDFNEASKQLKKAWGYTTDDSDKKKEENKCCGGQQCTCKGKASDNDAAGKQPKTKAEQIKEMLMREKEEQARKEREEKERHLKAIDLTADYISKLIDNRNFKTWGDAGICVTISDIAIKNLYKKDPLEEIIEPAASAVKMNYGFSSCFAESQGGELDKRSWKIVFKF